ncbi:hypothetical protein Tco_0986171 [Tanacetum coccineum]
MSDDVSQYLLTTDLIMEIRAITKATIRNHEASVKEMENQIGHIAKVLRERVPGTLPSSTETNPGDQVSHEDEEKKMKEAPIQKVVKTYRPPIPFTSRLVERKSVGQEMKFFTSLKKLQVNIPLVEALKGMPRYTRHLEDLMENKSKLDDESKATMKERCSGWLKNTLPSKEKDPWSFTLPYFVVLENLNAYIDQRMSEVILGRPFHGMADLDVKIFEGLISFNTRDDTVTYQMARVLLNLKRGILLATSSFNPSYRNQIGSSQWIKGPDGT